MCLHYLNHRFFNGGLLHLADGGRVDPVPADVPRQLRRLHQRRDEMYPGNPAVQTQYYGSAALYFPPFASGCTDQRDPVGKQCHSADRRVRRIIFLHLPAIHISDSGLLSPARNEFCHRSFHLNILFKQHRAGLREYRAEHDLFLDDTGSQGSFIL